jgi:hypothetical protein
MAKNQAENDTHWPPLETAPIKVSGDGILTEPPKNKFNTMQEALRKALEKKNTNVGGSQLP